MPSIRKARILWNTSISTKYRQNLQKIVNFYIEIAQYYSTKPCSSNPIHIYVTQLNHQTKLCNHLSSQFSSSWKCKEANQTSLDIRWSQGKGLKQGLSGIQWSFQILIDLPSPTKKHTPLKIISIDCKIPFHTHKQLDQFGHAKKFPTWKYLAFITIVQSFSTLTGYVNILLYSLVLI